MTFEQQSIALARHLGTGWEVQIPDFDYDNHYREVQIGSHTEYRTPTYEANPRAMSDAEQQLTPEQRQAYIEHLIDGRFGGLQYHYWILLTVAGHERLTAMVKTLGLWVDDDQPAEEAA